MIEIITSDKLINNIEDKISHWHDNIEIIDVIKGEVTGRISGEDYTLKEKDICIINVRAIHNLTTDREDIYLKRYQISRELFTRSEKIYTKYLENIISDERFSHLIYRRDDAQTDEIRNMLESIYDFVTKKPPAYELAVVGIVHLLMQKIYITFEKTKNKKLSEDQFLFRKMTDFIYTSYMEKLSLEMIAKKANVSKSKATNIFNQYAKRSPVDFLNLYRLKVATEKLREEDTSISEIAYDTGFNQPSYFNRLFFREYKMTPTEYRKNLKN